MLLSSSVLLSSLDLSDTHVYEPHMRARLGTLRRCRCRWRLRRCTEPTRVLRAAGRVRSTSRRSGWVTLHPTPYIPYPMTYTLYPTPYTLHTTHYTLHTTHYSPNPRNENPSTLQPLSPSVQQPPSTPRLSKRKPSALIHTTRVL